MITLKSHRHERLAPNVLQRVAAFLGITVLTLAQGCSSGSTGISTPGPTPTPVALTIVSSSLPAGTVGVPYATVLAAAGGSGSGYVWTVASGSLPTGVTLSGSGSLTGTPTANGMASFTAKVTDSVGSAATAALSITVAPATALTHYELTGDTSLVHDPSIIRQGSTYYVFVTDAGGQSGFIPIRRSTDKIAWKSVGYVFSTLPAWVSATVPQATGIWAPDISYFNGSYHLYYAVSTLGSQTSAIGLATTPTLDSSDPSYKWTDQGPILTSYTGANFNAIDPNILIDTDGSVWLTYGSYWNGIFQQAIDPATGKIISGTPYHLAQRAASVLYDPIEGASLVHKGGYYYLFTSWDACCNANPATDNYKIAVGRSTSLHGPFLDQNGIDMLSGGGTVLLQADGSVWTAPGGQTAYTDATGGDLLVFHALNSSQNYLDYLFVRSLTWANGWPVIGTSTL